MSAGQLQLRLLRVEDEVSFRKAVEEFKQELPPWPFAFGFDEPVIFFDYVERLEAHTRGIDLPENFVPHSYLVGVVQGIVVGRVSLRHTLNDYLAKVGGHIGYGVIPSQRRRGYAKEMLRQSLPLAAAVGIDRALVTCDEGNLGSRRVIEACGGVFEGLVDYPDCGATKRRYWIDTATR